MAHASMNVQDIVACKTENRSTFETGVGLEYLRQGAGPGLIFFNHIKGLLFNILFFDFI